MSDIKKYPCHCQCGRSLRVERMRGGFLLTLLEPGVEVDELIETHGMRENSIALDNYQLVDLSAWMVDTGSEAKEG